MQQAVIIRKLNHTDAAAFEAGFASQGWERRAEQYEQYLREQSERVREVFVADCQGKPVGYVCVLPEAQAGPFKHANIPCISDFNVLIAYQRRGIGSLLMNAAEEYAFSFSETICLGVGLHQGYGPAQRMYVQRGYLPDGSGVWYQDRLLANGGTCLNDDDLVLYLSKTKTC